MLEVSRLIATYFASFNGPPEYQEKNRSGITPDGFSRDCRPGTAPVPPHLCLILMQLG